MAVRTNTESQGFRLLQEDSLDDRPCAAVKKFVASVLDKKSTKDQDIALTYRNLVEYRDGPPSPGPVPCSLMDREVMLSPSMGSSPKSPTSAMVAGVGDRLPNELFDEICEDIDMKSGERMELDFVELLMEEDVDPQTYMTPVGLPHSQLQLNTSGGSSSSSCGGAGGNVSAASSNLSTPSNGSGSGSGCHNFVGLGSDSADWLSRISSPLAPQDAVSRAVAAPSCRAIVDTRHGCLPKLERASASDLNDVCQPAAYHHQPPSLSCSGRQHQDALQRDSPVFKVPHTPPTPRRLSCAGKVQAYSPTVQRHHPHGERVDLGPCSQWGSAVNAGNGTANIKNFLGVQSRCLSPGAQQQFSLCDFAQRSPGPKVHPISIHPPHQQQNPQQHAHYQNPHPHRLPLHNFRSEGFHNMSMIHPSDVSHSKYCNAPPPNVNVKDFAQVRYTHPVPAMGPGTHLLYGYRVQGSHCMESPLDQGYFSNESVSTGISSVPSPGLTACSLSSISSLSSMQSFSTRMPADSTVAPGKGQKNPGGSSGGQQPPGNMAAAAARHKTVHFADVCSQASPDSINRASPRDVDHRSFRPFSGAASSSDCIFDVENGQQMSRKMFSRHLHGPKPGAAPYVVPFNPPFPVGLGFAQPTADVSGYAYGEQPNCALMSQSSDSPAKMVKRECFEFDTPCPGKAVTGNGSSSGMYYVDDNQNMLHMNTVNMEDRCGAFAGLPYDTEANQMRPGAPHLQRPCDVPHPHRQQLYQQECLMPAQQESDKVPQCFGGCAALPLPAQDRIKHPSGQLDAQDVGYVTSHLPSAGQGLPGLCDVGRQPPSNCLNASQQGMGDASSISPHHGYHPADISTPCSPTTHRRGTMQASQRPVYGSLPPTYCYSADNAANSDGEGLMFTHQQCAMRQSNIPGASLWTGTEIPAHDPSTVQPHADVKHLAPNRHLEANPICGMHMGQQNFHPHPGICSGSAGCPDYKLRTVVQPGPASKAFSSQEKFLQCLILDDSNSAYRSHPLYPLLRDLVIAGMNFDDPNFHYQQLLSMLPHSFEKLLQNFLHRNPPSGQYHNNYSVESVLMDSLRLAHGNLVEKIRARQEQERCHKALTSTNIRSMEEFCEKFDHAEMVHPGSEVVNGCGAMLLSGQMPADLDTQGPLHIMTSMGPPGTKVMVAWGPGGLVNHMGFHPLKEEMMGPDSSVGIRPVKPESKKHPSLPKEAVTLMLKWLSEHKDNPYPNDDEKAMLIKQTGLTINQINYWFTNARRRILPKWAQCK